MKPIAVALLAVLAASSASALTPLARKYAVKRQAVVKEFSAKRRALVDSPDWELQSADKRRAALDALAAEAMARDDKITAEYDAERRQSRTGEDAGAAQTQQDRQRRLDEARTQAAQDSLRAKKIP